MTSQHWQLLQRLRAVEHSEVYQLIESNVFPAINVAILQKTEEVKSSASTYNFREAEDQLFLIREISNALDGTPLVVNIDTLCRHLEHLREAHRDQQRTQEDVRRRRAELERLEKKT